MTLQIENWKFSFVRQCKSFRNQNVLLKFVSIVSKFLKKLLEKKIRILQEFFSPNITDNQYIEFTWKDGKSTKLSCNKAILLIKEKKMSKDPEILCKDLSQTRRFVQYPKISLPPLFSYLNKNVFRWAIWALIMNSGEILTLLVEKCLLITSINQYN